VRAQLYRLYDITGAEMRPLERLFNAVEESMTVRARREKLAEEVERMERYYESVRPIIDKLEELKSLVLEGARFEEMAQSVENRFKGNSTHFLAEEKFRKKFLTRYPLLRDGLLQDIEGWSAENGQVFVYRGRQLRESLAEMRKMEVDFESTPGDLTVVGRLLQVLNVPDVEIRDKRPQRGSLVRQRLGNATSPSCFGSSTCQAKAAATASRTSRSRLSCDGTLDGAAFAQAVSRPAGSTQQTPASSPAATPPRERPTQQPFHPPARGSAELSATPTRLRPSSARGLKQSPQASPKPSPSSRRWQ